MINAFFLGNSFLTYLLYSLSDNAIPYPKKIKIFSFLQKKYFLAIYVHGNIQIKHKRYFLNKPFFMQPNYLSFKHIGLTNHCGQITTTQQCILRSSNPRPILSSLLIRERSPFRTNIDNSKVNQSINQSINQPINQSIFQPFNFDQCL